MLLERSKKHRSGIFEAPREKVAHTDGHKVSSPVIPWTKAQGGFEMLDRDIGSPRPQPQPTASVPSDGEARVKGKRTINQFNGGIDILTKIAEDVSSIVQNTWVVGTCPNRSSRKIDTLASSALGVISPTVTMECIVTMRGQGKRKSVIRIALDGLTKQVECRVDSVLFPNLSQ